MKCSQVKVQVAKRSIECESMFIKKNPTFDNSCLFAYVCIEEGVEECTHQNTNFNSEEMELHRVWGRVWVRLLMFRFYICVLLDFVLFIFYILKFSIYIFWHIKNFSRWVETGPLWTAHFFELAKSSAGQLSLLHVACAPQETIFLCLNYSSTRCQTSKDHL